MNIKHKLLLWLLLLMAVPQMMWADWSNTDDPTGSIKFWNDPAYNNDQSSFHFEWKTYDDYMVDEYMRSAILTYQIEGESKWTKIFDMSVSRKDEGVDNSVINFKINGDEDGTIANYDSWWDGSKGTRDRYMKMDWYIPNKVVGKTIKIRLDYGWEEHKEATVYRQKEWTKTITNLPESNITLEHLDPETIEMNYEGATSGTTIWINSVPYGNISTANEGIKLAAPANKDYKMDYEFKREVGSQKPTPLVYHNRGSVSIGRIDQPKDFSYIYNPCEHELILSWSLNPTEEKYPVIIERSTGTTMSSPKVIAELLTNEKSYIDYDAQPGKQYCYRVSHIPEGWKTTSDNGLSAEIAVLPENPSLVLKISAIDINQDNRKFTVRWEQSSWCDESELILVKENRSDKRTEEIPVDKLSGVYEDTEVATCTDYRYSLKMDNLGKTYKSNPESVTLADVSNFTSFLATKGVYSNRVELAWETDNPTIVKEFVIYRKELTQDAGQFMVMTKKSDQSSMVTWSDQTAVPGVYYNYRIEATVNCSGSSSCISAEDIGFVQTTGTVSGRLSYKGGTSVENACVVLRRTDEGEILPTNFALKFNGNSYAEAVWKKEHVCQENDFSVQFYVYPLEQNVDKAYILKNGSDYSSWIEQAGKALKVQVGETELTTSIDTLYNRYFHVSIVKQLDKIRLYINAVMVAEASYMASVCDHPTTLGIGNSIVNGNFGFRGYIDEVRVWNKALTDKQILQNHEIVLSGAESGLAAYWQFNEQLNTHFFDLAHKDFNYYGNDGVIKGATFTDIVPSEEQLALKAYTDKSGNYIIKGIPCSLEGSTYVIVPMLGTHQFDPYQQQVHLGGGGLTVVNGLDMMDISSFSVSGKVEYSGTRFPVEGATLYIDGETVVKDGEIVTTDINGLFEIEVPIGEHFIQVKMPDHTFTDEGRYPVAKGIKYDFQHDVSGLKFYDETRVKLAGRVVGGAVQAAFPLGFGKSKNNIGNAVVQLKPKKSYKLTKDENLYTEEIESGKIVSEIEYAPDYLRIFTDKKTGEYVAYLLPEEYEISSVKTSSYIIPKEQLTALDLKRTVETNETYTDTIKSYLPDGTEETEIIPDTFYYHLRRDFVYYVETPTLEIIQTKTKDSNVFGDEFYYYTRKDEQGKAVQDSIALYTLSAPEESPDACIIDYKFGSPVFRQLNPYNYRLKAYEKYINVDDAGREDIVPVTDGTWIINNDLSVVSENSSSHTELDADSTGVTYYRFRGGLPNLTRDANDPDNSYKQKMSVNFKTESGKVVDGINLSAYLLGAMPTGNNFVTTGPNIVTTVLRDPPGSGSTMSIETGTTVTNSSSFTSSRVLNTSEEYKFFFGVETEVGFGAMVQTDMDNDLTIGLSQEFTWEDGTTKTMSTEVTSAISTSDDTDYVGSAGDVFVGNATNIVFGAATAIDIYPANSSLDNQLTENGGFVIGENKEFRSNVTFGTNFVYSQTHIVNTLIPNLIMLRNRFLTKVENADGYVNSEDKQIYITELSEDDDRFGLNNDDEVFDIDTTNWTSEEIYKAQFIGPSYKVLPPVSTPDVYGVDSVRFYNQQVAGWIQLLSDNEEDKLRRNAELKENISYDAGVGEVTNSVTICNSSATSSSFEWQVTTEEALQMGFKANGLGSGFALTIGGGGGGSESSESETETCTTYSYTLVDNDANNYMSVDVYDSGNKSWSPYFKTRAGQTSCPYEGEETTQFYHPGRYVLHEATMRLEVPKIAIDKNVQADVPGGSNAVYELSLSNLPEVTNLIQSIPLRLKVDDTTNPNGAVLSIDGTVLNGEGILYWMPDGGEVLKKTLLLKQSRTDITEYENISLILTSDCEDGLEVSLPISAYFKPTSTSFKLITNDDKTVVNSVTGDTLMLTITDYDRAYENFAGIVLEYKPESASSWITEAYFANTEAEFARMQGNKYLIEGASIIYKWGMSSLIDRNYMVRARSLSKSVQGAFIAEYIGTPLTIIKDMKSPKELGYPTPSDGILKPGTNIAINFNEQIMKALVTDYNISVTGELNGHEVSNNVGLEFNGEENALTEANFNLEHKSFCIELWLRRTPGKEGVVWSHGNTESSMTVAFDTNDYLHLYYEDKDLKSRIPVSENGWMHLGISYNAISGTVNAVVSAQSIAERDKEIIKEVALGDYSINGKLKVGESFNTKLGLNGLKGYMNEFRIWTKSRDMSEITAENTLTLSGLENGLLAYWPMDEVNGTVAKEKVGAKNLLMNCGWYVYPKGYGLTFDGISQYLKVPAHLFPMTIDNSYTIEFWFKGQSQGESKMLAYASRTDKGTSLKNVLSLGFNENGLLTVQLEEITNQVSTKDFLDNQWHHLALVVNRASKGNIYVDGNLLLSAAAGEFPAIASGYVLIGAMGENGLGYKGSMDELRVWAAALNAEQIRMNMYHKLSGDEMGLKAYYPFEAYETDGSGIQNLNPTLKDQLQIGSLQEAQEALVIGSNPLSETGVSIKEKRQRENVNFNYTVSDNSIVIEVNESVARIENCMLEFAVNGVEDMNGNQQTSPITWTAYVNLNTLKWGDKSLTFEKLVLDELSFNLSLINQSGNKENFVIDNVPSWLTLSEVSGSLEPLETKVLTAAVDPSLNIGRYEEILYLRGNSDVTSPLSLSMKVNGERPDWSVNPKAFDYAMNLVGSLQIDGILSMDKEDMVAAFDGEECIGIAQPEYVASHDFYALFMTIYSNEYEGTPITFKAWDASTGRTYPTVEPQDMTFKADTLAGDLDKPVVLKALDEIQLTWNLRKGWNWVSVNVDNEYLPVPNLLMNPLKDCVPYIKGYDKLSMFYDENLPGENKWVGTLIKSGFKPSEAYKAQALRDTVFHITGRMFRPEDVTISMHEKWNWIGYVPTVMMGVNEALANLSAENGDVIKSQTDFALYYKVNGGWIGSLKYMKPGEGYLYKSVSDKSFTYPSVVANSAKYGISAKQIKPNSTTWEYDAYMYPDNMNIVAVLFDGGNEVMSDLYEVGAFVGNECRGASTLVDNRLFITAHGTVGEKLSFRIRSKETGEEYALNEKMDFSGDLMGDMDTPFVFDITDMASGLSAVQGMNIYPNPVATWLYIEGLSDAVSTIRMMDTTGKVIYGINGIPQENRINVANLPDGTYILVITTDDDSIYRKFVKCNNRM